MSRAVLSRAVLSRAVLSRAVLSRNNARRRLAVCLFVPAIAWSVLGLPVPSHAQTASGVQPGDPCDRADPQLDFDARPVNASGDPLPPCPDTPGRGGGDKLAVRVGTYRVRVGESVLVPVAMVNPQQVSVTNLNVEVGYLSDVVRVDGALVPGPLFGGALVQTNAAATGRVLIGVAKPAGAEGETGSNTLSSIRFTATGGVGARSPLTVKVAIINGPDGARLAAEERSGEIEIVGPDGGRAGDWDRSHQGHRSTGEFAF